MSDDHIDRYSRAQAIADGVLHDVTEHSQPRGLRPALAIAHVAWCELVDTDDETGSLETRRDELIGEVIRVVQEQKNIQSDTIAFVYQAIPLYLRIHGGDDHAPVLTLMHQRDL